MYRLQIHHVTHIGGTPVEVLDLQIAQWQALPVWQRILRRSPLVRASSKLEIEPEDLDDTFDTLEDADDAARENAEGFDDEVRPDTAVMVVVDDDEGNTRVLRGWYPGDRGRG